MPNPKSVYKSRCGLFSKNSVENFSVSKAVDFKSSWLYNSAHIDKEFNMAGISRTDQLHDKLDALNVLLDKKIMLLEKHIDLQNQLIDNIIVKLDSMGVVVKDISDTTEDLHDDMVNRR